MEQGSNTLAKVAFKFSLAEAIRHYFNSYETADREAQEELLADNFIFTSPLDYKLDKNAYFEKCWTYTEKLPSYQIDRIYEKDNTAFVSYICKPKYGKPFRNIEFFQFEGAKIREIEVYFGSFIQLR